MKFTMRIKNKTDILRGTRHLSAAHDKMIYKTTRVKEEQLNAAVEYCRENDCKGYAALSTGRFPMIKDPRTINNRLENIIVTGEEKSYSTILTKTEEEKFVKYLLNKNR